MAEKNITYPVINAVRWWIIRKSFKRTIPDIATNSYLSSVLNITEGSAQTIISPLKKMGLVDKDGKPTERARRWRDDEEYASVCDEIRKEVYPSELLAAFPDPEASRANIERWFSKKTGLGESAVRGMAAFYLLLCEADPTKQDSTSTSVKAPKPSKGVPSSAKLNIAKTKGSKREAPNGAVATIEPEAKISSSKENLNGFGHSLHIDIQIHISSDASADQIDHIFASMAKHLYKGHYVNE
jgi:hypothetical protein